MRNQVTRAEAVAPFHVVIVGVRYCAITDAICGTWSQRDSEMTYATYGGACWRAELKNRKHEGADYAFEVRDANGHVIIAPPQTAPHVDDGLLF